MKKETEKEKNCNYIAPFFHKYKLMIMTLICIPLLLSVACYFSVPYFNQAGSSAWLSFWGGYLGSVIMAGITLFVLNKQLAQNHKENLCNAVLQIAILTNNEEKTQIDKLGDALIEFQSSFDYLTINQIAERMLNQQFLVSDVELLSKLIRDVDSKGFKVDLLLKPIPTSNFIVEYNMIYNRLYNGYGLLIDDFIFFINLIKDLLDDKDAAKSIIIDKINKNKIIDAKINFDIPGYKKPKSIVEIIEEKKYYENILSNSSKIIQERLVQDVNEGSRLKEELKTAVINMLDYEYKCINDKFNEKIKIYE
ncbi:MAG: hypothetical protein KHX42_06430 [Prevotella sp.]|nr:hypothetical protein [Prevotella sp.]